MQMNGSAKVSAPRCTSYSATGTTLTDYTGSHSNGDAVLTAAIAAGATGNGAILVANSGFPNSGTVIIGYGTANEEEVVYTALSSTTGLSIGDADIVKAHAVNERVVLKPTVSFMPGTVQIKMGNTVLATDANKDGVLVQAATDTDDNFTSGTVDYSTGRVKLVLANDASTLTFVASALSDAPDAAGALADGSAAHKTFQQYAFTKNDAPGSAMVSNLGDATVGFFFEVSRNGGKSFTSAGLASSGSIGALGSTTVTCPGGRDQVVRFRAGSQVADSTFEGNQSGSKDPEGRIIEPRVVTVDTATKLNHG